MWPMNWGLCMTALGTTRPSRPSTQGLSSKPRRARLQLAVSTLGSSSTQTFSRLHLRWVASQIVQNVYLVVFHIWLASCVPKMDIVGFCISEQCWYPGSWAYLSGTWPYRWDNMNRNNLVFVFMYCTVQWVDVPGGDTSHKAKSAHTEQNAERTRLRIQDRELQEMADGGWCLSMHQPWASLLICGIKR